MNNSGSLIQHFNSAPSTSPSNQEHTLTGESITGDGLLMIWIYIETNIQLTTTNGILGAKITMTRI